MGGNSGDSRAARAAAGTAMWAADAGLLAAQQGWSHDERRTGRYLAWSALPPGCQAAGDNQVTALGTVLSPARP
jgi:hypothetical protein